MLSGRRAVEVLNGSLSAQARYSDYHVEHQIVLLKCMDRDELQLLSHDYRVALWTRPALAMAVLHNFGNASLAVLLRPESFALGPVFLCAAIQVELLRRLPADIFSLARPEMMASLTPDCLRSLTPTHVSLSHPRAFSLFTADHLEMLAESCYPALGMGHVASMLGSQSEADTLRLWRAAQRGGGAVHIAFMQHLHRHPCQALRRRRYMLMRAAIPIVEQQCRFAWNTFDLMLKTAGAAGEGGQTTTDWYLHRFPLVVCIVMGVTMTALLVQTCVATMFEVDGL